MANEEKQKKVKSKKEDNLIRPEELNARLTPEERRENASKAGKASAEKRKENRKLMELTRKILDMPVADSYQNTKMIMQRLGITADDMNYASAIMATMIVKAVGGDANAARYVRDSAGYDSMTVLKEEQFEYTKENGTNINVSVDGELSTRSRVQIYLPERDDDPE